MEELQSTEILDREILEDARKKALRILKTADETIAAKTAEWDKKTAEAIDTLEKKYGEQKKLAADKIMARLPIDKLRAKVERIEALLQEAVEDWYKSNSRRKILELLTKELSNRLKICKEIPAAKKSAYYSGLDKKEAETVLKAVNIDAQLREISSVSHYPQITLEMENTRIIASIQAIIDQLLHDKREELVEALVDRDFMGVN